jgi:putative FmdB family regulatory protein
MPIYEYKCDKCGREFEQWQSICDPAVDTCSECGGKASRLISHSSFVLKGSGWYVTDYARKGSSCPAPSTSSSSSDSSSGDASSGNSSSD